MIQKALMLFLLFGLLVAVVSSFLLLMLYEKGRQIQNLTPVSPQRASPLQSSAHGRPKNVLTLLLTSSLTSCVGLRNNRQFDSVKKNPLCGTTRAKDSNKLLIGCTDHDEELPVSVVAPGPMVSGPTAWFSFYSSFHTLPGSLLGKSPDRDENLPDQYLVPLPGMVLFCKLPLPIWSGTGKRGIHTKRARFTHTGISCV